VGEFYWRVKIHDKTTIFEYVNTPEILSQEITSGDIIWSLAEYINAEDVVKAFKISTTIIPVEIGIAVNQPSSTQRYLYPLIKIAFLGVLASLIIVFIFIGISKPKEVVSMNFVVAPRQVEKFSSWKINNEQEFHWEEIVSPSFTIDTQFGTLLFQVDAPLDDSWLELETDLVNEATGETISFEIGMEYYHGYDEDNRYWMEGEKIAFASISAPKKGQYHLNVHTKSNHLTNLAVKISLKEGVVLISNFLLVFLLIIALPLLLLLNEIFFYSLKNNWWSSDDD